MTILVFWDENEISYCYSHVSRRDRDFRKSFLVVEREKIKLTLAENSRDREFLLTSVTVYQLNTFKILSQSASGIFSTHSTHAYKHFRYWRLCPHLKHIFRCQIHQLWHMYHQNLGPHCLDIGHWDFYILAAILYNKMTNFLSKYCLTLSWWKRYSRCLAR